MERTLKERLVGAVLLVFAAVLVVPLFLDGPEPQQGLTRQPLHLPAAEHTDARTRTIRLEQSRDTPTAVAMPADETADPPAPPRPVPQATEPTDRARVAAASEPPVPVAAEAAAPVAPPAPAATPPAAVQRPAATAAAPGESWVVQLGSFGNRENAERLAAELRERRYQSFVARHDSDGRTLHRVRVGPAGDRSEAERLVARLAADGYRAQPVRE